MAVERLSTGNPDTDVFTCGAKVTTSRPGRADEVSTMWFNNCDANISGATGGSTTTLTVGVPTASLLSMGHKVAVTGSTDATLNGTWEVTAVDVSGAGTVTVNRNASIAGSIGSPRLKNGTLSTYSLMSNGRSITTSSEVPAVGSPERTVDTTVTENFDDASSASITSGNVTLRHLYRDTVVPLSDGEEQVNLHKVFLTDNTSGPSLKTTYDYHLDGADPINRRTLAMRTAPSVRPCWNPRVMPEPGP